MTKAVLDREFLKHQNRLFMVCRKLVHSDEVAQDLVNQTYVRAVGACGHFRGHSSVFTWLHRIAVNLWLDHLRRSRRISIGFDDDMESHLARSEASVPCRSSLQTDVTARIDIQRLLSELPKQDAQFIWLHVVEGYQQTELARCFGVSNKKLSVRKHRILSRLRSMIELQEATSVVPVAAGPRASGDAGPSKCETNQPATLHATEEPPVQTRGRTRGHRSYQMEKWLKAAGPKHPLTLQVLELPDVASDESCVYAVMELAGGRTKGEINVSTQLRHLPRLM